MKSLAVLLLGTCLLTVVIMPVKATEGEEPDSVTTSRVTRADGGDATDFCEEYGDGTFYIAADDFCEETGLNKPGELSCALLGLVETAFVTFANTKPSCPADKQTPSATRSMNGALLPGELSDQRPLPTNLPASVITQEGPSIYWHWQNLFNFELWCPCAATNVTHTITNGYVRMANSSQNWLRPTGWNIISTLWLKDGPAQAGFYWPFATILEKGSTLAIFIRGTATPQDWITDFSYGQNRAGNLYFPGAVHAGFAGVTNQLWDMGLRSALKKYVLRGHVRSVVVSGHSMGAGVATLVSYAAQSYLNQQLRTGGHWHDHDHDSKKIRVDALLFAPPNVGDATFTAAFNNLVNGRRIYFPYDIITQVPCAPVMTACPNILVPTPNVNGFWPYSTVGGSMSLLPANMPQQPQVWALLDKLYPCQALRFAMATHICSYQCYFSQFAKGGNNMCLLWDTTKGGGVGTYCFLFPNKIGPPYPYE